MALKIDEIVEDEGGAPRRRGVREHESERGLRAMERAPEGLTRGHPGGPAQHFDLPPALLARFKAAGWSVEWKMHTVINQPDAAYAKTLYDNHWQPVLAHEVPGFVSRDEEGAVIRGGLMLMKRPMYLTEAARREDNAARDELLRVKTEQLGQTPAGTLTRGQRAPQIKRSVEPSEIPED